MVSYSRFSGHIARTVVAFISLCGLLIWGQTAPESAIVTGRVLDFQSRPLSGARIVIFPMDVGVSGPLPEAMTDAEGRYRLVAPPFGRTRFCAVKETAGYPNTQGLLFVSGKDSRPEVHLGAGSHLENVDIRLGPPDGQIEGVVIDAATRAPIQTARITLRRDDNSGFYSTSLPRDGHFLFALPPVPIEIMISAPGYSSWRYKNPETGARNIVMSTQDHRVINVELTPGNSARMQP